VESWIRIRIGIKSMPIHNSGKMSVTAPEQANVPVQPREHNVENFFDLAKVTEIKIRFFFTGQ
jgi:hypothetical protein